MMVGLQNPFAQLRRSGRAIALALAIGVPVLALATSSIAMAQTDGSQLSATTPSSAPAPATHFPPLKEVVSNVQSRFDDVKHLSEAQAKALIGRDDVLLVDTRELAEFQVSRLPGAVQLDPDAWRWTVMSQLGEQVRGKTVVFYCSVGVRSSKMAAHVQDAMMEAGAKQVFNLDGGIFRWHNMSLPLEDERGSTDVVHPYDAHWGKLVRRQDHTSYSPVPRQ